MDDDACIMRRSLSFIIVVVVVARALCVCVCHWVCTDAAVRVR